MKVGDSPIVTPFESFKPENVEVFGILKRELDPPIKSLLAWGPEVKVSEPRVTKKNSLWVSESHDAFKVFTTQTPENLRPTSVVFPKPVQENIEKPPELPNTHEKSFSQSPEPHVPKTPKTAKKTNQRQMERIKKLKQTTRWMANSSFKTYFGKPVFANYGQGNVNPAYGGLMYGDYMKTHNIAPHEGSNNPSTQQVYEIAEIKALQRQAKPQHLPRKCKDEDRLPPEEIDKIKKRSQILPKEREKPSKKIIKNDLLQEKLFKSEHNSSNESEDDHPKNKSKTTLKPKKTLQNKEEPISTQSKIKESVNKSAKEPDSKLTKDSNSKTIKEQEDKTHKDSEELKIEIEEVPKPEEVKSHDAHVQAEDCDDCAKGYSLKKLLRTSYQDMTSKVVVDKNNQIVEPYKYCNRCRDYLYAENVMQPPYSLAEIPPQELNPKNYKTLPPQWTQRIPAAGKLSYRSPSAYSVIFGEES
jgi:hypothetical protein